MLGEREIEMNRVYIVEGKEGGTWNFALFLNLIFKLIN